MITIVTAGAGTGKTHRITTEITEAVAAGLSVDGLLATTFTRKAAAELQERVQAALARAGHRDAAVQLPEALIGTVNAICGRLLSEFALEAGLSPELVVLDEAAEVACFEAAVSAIVAQYEEGIRPIAWRLGLAGVDQERDWVEIVRRIASSARANRLLAGEVLACIPRTLAGIEAILAAPDPAGPESLDRTLRTAMEALLTQATGWNDLAEGPKNTRETVERVRQAAERFDPENGRFLPWSEWAALSKLKPGKKRADAFAPIAEAAAAHDCHPRLHADIQALVAACYQAASRALEAYDAHKKREGLLDFCDQEALLLALLERDATVRDELRSRFGLLFVDEFQDTSPLQLALFLQLAALAPSSVWVGDPKQAIYGFRGTDPALMQSVLQALGPVQGDADILGTSRRSRPGLVEFANAVFVPAFAKQKMDANRVRLTAHRTDLPGQGPPLLAWRLPKGKKAENCAALAGAVARQLAQERPLLVQDRANGTARPLRAGDVAILCKTNDMVAAVAEALREHGVRVAAARDGLLETPEVRLALACLRRLSSAGDSLAAAEIAHFCNRDAAGEWLSVRLTDPDAELDHRVSRLDAVRPQAAELSPVAALGEALATAGVLKVVSAWPDPTQRLANLEALFASAAEYEDSCRSARRAATPSGLVAWLQSTDPEPKQPPSFADDTVTVLTYHRAKGLEWPFVIMAQLDHKRAPSAFEVTVEGRTGECDITAPLDGRWVRYWPWPYGRQSSGIPLGDRATTCPEHLSAEARASAEAVRLGYVGVTRARDYLAFALNGPAPGWLESFAPGLGSALMGAAEGCSDLAFGGATVAVAAVDVMPSDGGFAAASEALPALAWPDGAPPDFLPARFSPSQLKGLNATPKQMKVQLIELGPRLGRAGSDPRTAVGDALHRFLAADDPEMPHAARHAMASALLDAFGVFEAITPEDCIVAGDRLWDFVRQRYGASAEILREWPIQRRMPNETEMRGRVDLLIRATHRSAVIDHKSFPGSEITKRAEAYAVQLMSYTAALDTAGGEAEPEVLVHLPVSGRMALLTNTQSEKIPVRQ